MQQVAAFLHAYHHALVDGGGLEDDAIADRAFAALAARKALQQAAAFPFDEVMTAMRGDHQPMFAGAGVPPVVTRAARFAARHAAACTSRATRCDAVGWE